MHNLWLILIGAAGILLAAAAAHFLFRKAPDALEIERRRRMTLLAEGRITGGQLDEIRGRVVCYHYEVAGVGYDAAQDLGGFPDIADSSLIDLSGPVAIRYHRANPGNSMVHCESWSGLPWPASTKSTFVAPVEGVSNLSGALDRQ